MASSRSPLLILVITVSLAWTAPQQSQGDGAAGDVCRPARPTTMSSGAGCKLDPSGEYYEGDCWAQLLQRGPCPYMHWLVLDKDTDSARCQFQVCPDHKALVGGQCERLGQATSSKHCPPTQQLIITEYGEQQCECPLGMAYYSADQRCYHPYEQGPCQEGQTLQVVYTVEQAKVECVASICPAGEVALNLQCEEATSTTPSEDYQCYKITTTGPCKAGFLALDPVQKRVTCIDNTPYSILSIARFGCIPGSKRDTRGTCREVFNLPRKRG